VLGSPGTTAPVTQSRCQTGAGGVLGKPLYWRPSLAARLTPPSLRPRRGSGPPGRAMRHFANAQKGLSSLQASPYWHGLSCPPPTSASSPPASPGPDHPALAWRVPTPSVTQGEPQPSRFGHWCRQPCPAPPGPALGAMWGDPALGAAPRGTGGAGAGEVRYPELGGVGSHERAGREQGFRPGGRLAEPASPRTPGVLLISCSASSPHSCSRHWGRCGESWGQSGALGDPGTGTGRKVARRHPAPLRPRRDGWPSRTGVVGGPQALPLRSIPRLRVPSAPSLDWSLGKPGKSLAGCIGEV